MKIKMYLAVLFLGGIFPFCVQAAHAGTIKIVTTTTTLGALAQEVTGETAQIYCVVSPKQNIHMVSPNPKDVLKLKKAQVFIHQGLDSEPWRDSLLNAAGNQAFMGEASGAIDVSKGIELLEIPTTISRFDGDIHVYGNPHYASDPENAFVIVQTIADHLAIQFPEHSDVFKKNAKLFQSRLKERLSKWHQQMSPFKGSWVVTYHGSWPYFMRRFGLQVLDHLEPKPGIPPTSKHLSQLISQMKEKKVKVIIREPYNESRTPNKVAEAVGAAVVTLSQAVGASNQNTDYLQLMDSNIDHLVKALGGSSHV